MKPDHRDHAMVVDRRCPRPGTVGCKTSGTPRRRDMGVNRLQNAARRAGAPLICEGSEYTAQDQVRRWRGPAP